MIPPADLAEFMRLPADVQSDVQLWLAELTKVTRPIQQNLAAVARRMGCSAKTARRKYDYWRHAQHWRALINRSKIPEARGANPEFIAWWQGLCKQNGRKCAPAYRQFVRQYKAGHPIPGLDPAQPRDHLPPGCSYDNLMRHRPSDFELAAARIGRHHAADYRPKIFTTRVGLAVGQRIIFDDLWHDFKVVTLGQRRPLRLLQLHAHDLFSACNFARGLKPRLEDDATGKSIGLKENEMLHLVAHVLTEFGYHPDGCALMVEHGTASIREELEKTLYDLTAGRVTVERSGIAGDPAFAGQYGGLGKGNFRFKAALESAGNLIHNETAALLQFPGQTGSNSRLNQPEELPARGRHASALIQAMTALPSDRAALLRLPFLELNQAKWLVEEIMERINQRTDHALEGWIEAGLTTMDFELPDIGAISAQKFLALPAEKQAALQAIATPRPRKLSPREVFEAGRARLIRLRPEQSARLLRAVAGREVTVGKDHLITFHDETISPAPLRYLAHHFAPGDRFTVVVNPMSPHTAHLFNARGGWVGIISAWQTVRRDDIDALNRQLGHARKVESELLAPVAATGARIIQQRIEDAQHNAVILNRAAPVTPAERARADLIAREGPSAEAEILATPRSVRPSALAFARRPRRASRNAAAAAELLTALTQNNE
jgi:hypothetical protein